MGEVLEDRGGVKKDEEANVTTILLTFLANG
jgi:hypothetical protein